MNQKADHFGWFFAWVKKPTILGGSSHESKSRPFWVVLRMGQKADHFGGFFAWVKKPTILGGSSHGSKSRPFWWVLRMGQKADHRCGDVVVRRGRWLLLRSLCGC